MPPDPLKQTARDEQLGSHLSHTIEPGCPTRHPRLLFRLEASQPQARRRWGDGRIALSLVMAGLVPAIHVFTS